MSAEGLPDAAAPRWFAPAQLREAQRRGDSPGRFALSAPHCLFVQDLDGEGGDEALAHWLAELPCPVVALAPATAFWQRAADCLVADVAEARLVQAQVSVSPLAALACVQLLRAIEALAVEPALTLESMAYGLLQDGPEFQRWRAQSPGIPVTNAEPAVLMQREHDVLHVQLNRPQARNALDVAMRDGLVEAFELAAADLSIRRIHVSGNGSCYSVGGDLAEFGARSDGASAHRIRCQHNPARALLPIAARTEFELHGACIGSGIELPAFAARVRAHRDSWFQLPELRLGLIPGSGGCVSLPRRIGRQRTAWLVLTASRIRAEQALDWGLVDELVDETASIHG